MITRPTRRRAFTIVELLVVIAIIGVLVGLLLPALGGVKRRGRKLEEVNDLRQVSIAWFAYANGHNDAALPGYLEPGVQEKWKLKYKYPTGDTIPPGLDFSPTAPNIAGPWTWRLMSYFDFAHDVVQRYRQEVENDIFKMVESDETAERIATTPAFAYNGYYLGGWLEMKEGQDSPFVAARFIDAKDPDDPFNRLAVVTRSIAQIRRSSELIVFCSASPLPPRTIQPPPDDADGAFILSPPILAELEIWGRSTSNDRTRVEAFVRIDGENAPVPIGRYNGQAAILRADGSCDTQTPGSLVDQTLFINTADDPKFTHTAD